MVELGSTVVIISVPQKFNALTYFLDRTRGTNWHCPEVEESAANVQVALYRKRERDSSVRRQKDLTNKFSPLEYR